LRRTAIDGDLNLYHYQSGQWAGYASGGFMADVRVTGKVVSGSQQQYIIRNSEMGEWSGGVWNMVFVGSTGAPESHCSNSGSPPATTVEETPLIAEKAYIVSEGEGFSLMVPRVEQNKVGVTKDFDN
jgi:hypothetical protein